MCHSRCDVSTGTFRTCVGESTLGGRSLRQSLEPIQGSEGLADAVHLDPQSPGSQSQFWGCVDLCDLQEMISKILKELVSSKKKHIVIFLCQRSSIQRLVLQRTPQMVLGGTSFFCQEELSFPRGWTGLRIKPALAFDPLRYQNHFKSLYGYFIL